MQAGGIKGFLRRPDFWKAEKDASILIWNKDHWLQEHTPEAFQMAKQWLANLGVTEVPWPVNDAPMSTKLEGDDEVLLRDAKRTYRSEENIDTLTSLLFQFRRKAGDYHQATSYAAGLLTLFFDIATVFKALTVINEHPKYIPGYWKAEAISCARDGWVLFDIIEKRRPDLHKHLMAAGMFPGPLPIHQKWFCGLCINHLPYRLLFPYLTNFFQQGHIYLFKFALALMLQEADKILLMKTHEISAFIKMEGVSEDILMQALKGAESADISSEIDKLNMAVARTHAFQNHLSLTLQNANAILLRKGDEDDEVEFSDDEDEMVEEAVDEITALLDGKNYNPNVLMRIYRDLAKTEPMSTAISGAATDVQATIKGIANLSFGGE